MFHFLTDAIKEIWPMLTIFLVVIISIRLMYLHNSREKFVFHKEFMNLVFVVYILILFQLLTNTEMNSVSGMNLVPFTEILRYDIGTPGFYLNVVGNILIFIPFGYFVSTYIKASKVSHIILVTLLTSSIVEWVQYNIGRTFDIDDILLNIVGAVIGYLLFIGLTAIKKHLPKFFRSEMFYNLLCLAFCIMAFLYYLTVMGIKIY